MKLNGSSLVPWLKVVRHLDPWCFTRQQLVFLLPVLSVWSDERLRVDVDACVCCVQGKEEVMLKAGGGAVVAALVARTAVAPLERAKILVQTGRATGLMSAFR